MKNKFFTTLLIFCALLAPANNLVGMEAMDDESVKKNVELSKTLQALYEKCRQPEVFANIFVFIEDFDRKKLAKLALCGGSFFYNVFKIITKTHPFQYTCCVYSALDTYRLKKGEVSNFLKSENRDPKRLEKYKHKIRNQNWNFSIKLEINIFYICPARAAKFTNPNNDSLKNNICEINFSNAKATDRCRLEKYVNLENLPNLKKLSFWRGEMDGVKFFKIINSAKNLEQLFFDSTTITASEEAILKNESITFFKLCKNSRFNPYTILDSFKKLETLEIEENESFCNLSRSFPTQSKHENLKNLKLWNCNNFEISDLIFSLEIFPNLETLCVRSLAIVNLSGLTEENSKIENIFSKINHTKLRKLIISVEIKNLCGLESILKSFPELVSFEGNRTILECDLPDNDQIIEFKNGIVTVKMWGFGPLRYSNKIFWRKKHP